MKLVGFLNTGNTCYINSVLECFINDILFRNKLIKSTELKEEYSIVKKVVELINLKDDGEYSFMKYNLNQFNELLFNKSYFRRFEQYDAHEFLLKFMDMFENECKDIYVGQTRLTIKCTKCGNTKDVFEDFTTLNLTVNETSENVLELIDLFNNYLKKEIINESNNLYYCEKCKMNTPSEQKTVLFKLPKRLIIVFKRYSDSGVKINKKIKYPINSLLIKETQSGKIFNYSLTNLIYHFGNLNNGHYLNSSNINDRWYLIDDNHISMNSEVILNNVNSYILFYSLK